MLTFLSSDTLYKFEHLTQRIAHLRLPDLLYESNRLLNELLYYYDTIAKFKFLE